MMKRLLLMVALVAVVGCGRADSDAETALADSLSRDLELAPVDTMAELADVPTETPAAQPAPTPAPPPRTAAPRPTPTPTRDPAPIPSRSGPTLSAGTIINATAVDTLTSRHHKPGYVFVARTSEDLKDNRGRIVVPAGAEISFTVMDIAPSENKGDTAGVLVLEPTQLMVDGRAYTVTGNVDYVEKYLKGRGVQAGDVAKVGAGAAIGAIAGRIIGGKKGTVIGGAVGAAVGTQRAIETVDRDVVIPPGGGITMTLSQDVVLN